MVRFSCFHSHVNSQKPKKTVQLSVEAMQKALQDCSQNRALKDFTNSSGLNPIHLKVQGDALLDNSDNNVTTSSSVDRDWKSEEIRSKQASRIKKCRSLESGLDQEGRFSGGNDSEEETDHGFSCDGFRDHNESVIPVGGKDSEICLPNPSQEALPSDSLPLSSDLVCNESIFSIGDPQQSEKGRENSDTHCSGEFAGESGDHIPRSSPVIVRSSSLPNISSLARGSAPTYLAPHSRSSEDLHILDLRQKEMLVHEVGTQVMQDQERDDSASNNEKNNCENPADDCYNSYNYVGSAKDWIIPVMDEVNKVKNLQGESSAHQWEELPSKDFKFKRIEEWVTDLQHCSPLEETNEFDSNDHLVEGGASVLDNLTAARLDGKVTAGMEAAKKYISSLSATATTAQLANHGLVVIPFLSAFVSLRALNLSGNAIVRITAGSLPRGLHILNLSKNNIATIEGLRELTRLRVLDLSYNRIVRIGHGLASCSSLKELYLAGNKISEVDGLHRLLKLNVLDLRFNKISTAKCLGQLAANYNSLQAISLEGNPAQKNVGDEQLKKYLQGLLPHLAYLNRQPIKVGTFKDTADRSARLGFTAHQIDRGLRSEHKTLQKGSHGVAAHKVSSSSIHGRISQAVVSPKQSSGRHGRLPPRTNHGHHFYDFGSKLLSFRSDLFIRRSRSEETLARSSS
uniref:Outer arm dynein light chain 1 protein n=1 Tax=Davidia involucrata TaxID=16924 RepID=A0A5B7B3K4_DAVIN